MPSLHEPAREIPVVDERDVCVVGGGCTGVCAAVAAARNGARTCLIEANGFFGGVATAGLVNIWHKLVDESLTRQIIGGLTLEILERLLRRNAVVAATPVGDGHYHFNTLPLSAPLQPPMTNVLLNTEELKIELDELIAEAGVRPFLHARCVAVVHEHGRPVAAIIEDKSGRRAIRARYFIDATGDGDFIVQAGLPWRRGEALQPSTTCARMSGVRALWERNPGFDLKAAVFNPKFPEALKDGFLWAAAVPGAPDEMMIAGTRVPNVDAADADQLTRAEIEGRRQVRCITEVLRRHFASGDQVGLTALPAWIGVRETRHARCRHHLTVDELFSGTRFPDAIANGTYPVDIHHADRPGITFRRLDGTETYFPESGAPVERRWREPSPDAPTFYQIPYRSLVPEGATNVLCCGRLVDADRGAYAAIRVMVNCNQTGEAAGTAAALACETNESVADIDAGQLRRRLAEHGALMI